MGGLLTLGSWVRQFPEINTVDNPGDNHIATIQGISVVSYNVGCFVGAVITIFIGDLLGRRKMIFLGSSIMIVGAILQCSSFSLAQLIVGRIITGFGNGMYCFRNSSSFLNVLGVAFPHNAISRNVDDHPCSRHYSAFNGGCWNHGTMLVLDVLQLVEYSEREGPWPARMFLKSGDIR